MEEGAIMRMMPYQSFLAEYKPACFENLDRLKPEIREQLEQYPFHQNYENAAIFFQDKSLKEQFLQGNRRAFTNFSNLSQNIGINTWFSS
jgi:hypothetical protein